MKKQSIIAGDALKSLPNIESESADLIIADPPYNLAKDYGNNSDNLGFDEYLDFTRSWAIEAKRVLSSEGTLYVFMGFKFISYIYDILERELDMQFNSWITWHYTQGTGKKRGFSPRHEDILMFTKTGNYIFNLDEIRIPQKFYRTRNNMRGANPGDVWQFSHVHYCNSNRQNHPTQKPEGLYERMILASSNVGSKVVDPFAGSGTTLRVCQQLERNGIGIEINPEYVELIRDRLAQEFSGFDSADPRMTRVPKDLNNEVVRENYIQNHKKWFLKNHPKEIQYFNRMVAEKYPKQQRSPQYLFTDNA